MVKKLAPRSKKTTVSSRRQALPKETKKAVVKRAPRIKKVSLNPQEEIVLGSHETEVQQAKFSHPMDRQAYRVMPQELPKNYGKDKLIIQARDTHWIYSYWEVSDGLMDKFKHELGDEFHKARHILRVYDVSSITFNGANANRYFDIYLSDYANSWYINTGSSGKSWCVDYGLLLHSGRFVTILRSNIITTPSDGPSWVTDEEWMIPEEMFARLYGMGFGLGASSPVGKAWQERIKKVLFSGAMASPGMASMASPVKKALPRERKFWMVVDCELIVYGATEADAAVTVQGRPIKLRPDGTFTLRFALPDGKQVIPVEAESSDKEEKRRITPIVTRETK